jgi:hypothetical protein
MSAAEAGTTGHGPRSLAQQRGILNLLIRVHTNTTQSITSVINIIKNPLNLTIICTQILVRLSLLLIDV